MNVYIVVSVYIDVGLYMAVGHIVYMWLLDILLDDGKKLLFFVGVRVSFKILKRMFSPLILYIAKGRDNWPGMQMGPSINPRIGSTFLPTFVGGGSRAEAGG